MYTISGSGCRQVLCSWIKTIVGCVTDAYADYVHYDSFTDTNGVTIPNHTPEKAVGAYAEISGTFDIQSNTCSRLTSLGYPNIQLAAGADFDATWVINQRATTCSNGPLFRCGGADHPWDAGGWYCECLTGVPIRLANNNGGWGVKYTGTNGPTAGGVDTVRILAVGNAITVWLNGVQEINVSDAYANTSAYIGWLINHDQETTPPYSTLDSLIAV